MIGMGKSIRHKWVNIMLNTLIGAGGSNNQVFREKKRKIMYFPINASVAIL